MLVLLNFDQSLDQFNVFKINIKLVNTQGCILRAQNAYAILVVVHQLELCV